MTIDIVLFKASYGNMKEHTISFFLLGISGDDEPTAFIKPVVGSFVDTKKDPKNCKSVVSK